MKLLSRFAALALLIGMAGCKNDDDKGYIYQQKVAKPEAILEENHVDRKPREERMLVVMLTDQEKQWFFKLTGPSDEVAKAETDFDALISSLKFVGGKPAWRLPNKWSEEQSLGMRFATIRVPSSSKPMELTVTPLPVSDLLSNVNRWRGQLSLSPVKESELSSCSKPFDVAGKAGWRIDLTGKPSGQGMSGAPFAGGNMPRGMLPPANPNSANNPNSDANPNNPAAPDPHAGLANNPTATPSAPANSPVSYTKPESWKELPAGGFSKASFELQQDPGKISITITDLVAGSGTLLENVNRWRTQVGLEPVDEKQLTPALEKITIDGQQGVFVELEGNGGESILGAIVDHGGQTWYVKLRGNSALAQSQKEAFRKFAESIRFVTGKE